MKQITAYADIRNKSAHGKWDEFNEKKNNGDRSDINKPMEKTGKSVGIDMRIREWECPVCCAHHDRDINASNNILKKGLNILSGRQRTAGTAESGRKQVCCPTKRPG